MVLIRSSIMMIIQSIFNYWKDTSNHKKYETPMKDKPIFYIILNDLIKLFFC